MSLPLYIPLLLILNPVGDELILGRVLNHIPGKRRGSAYHGSLMGNIIERGGHCSGVRRAKLHFWLPITNALGDLGQFTSPVIRFLPKLCVNHKSMKEQTGLLQSFTSASLFFSPPVDFTICVKWPWCKGTWKNYLVFVVLFVLMQGF